MTDAAPVTITAAWQQWAADHAARPAYTQQGVTLSYQDVDQLSRHFAAYLSGHLGLQKGDRLALILPNILQFPVAVLGALRAGLVVVSVNPHYTAEEIAYQLNDSGALIALIFSDLPQAWHAISQCQQLRYVVRTSAVDLFPFWQRCWWWLRHQKSNPQRISVSCCGFLQALRLGEKSPLPLRSVAADDLALLQYTGGTTGAAKGAMLAHRHLLANLGQICSLLGDSVSEAAETAIAALPLYHIYSLTLHCLVMPSLGASVVLVVNPGHLDTLVAQIQRHRITFLAGINPLFVNLCRHIGFTQLDFQHLKTVCSGGVALTASAAEQWERVTGCTILEGYGLSETAPVVAANRPGAIVKGSVGWPVADTVVRIVDEQGKPLPQGEAGELQVKGPQVMSGYWQAQTASAEAFQDGWLKTGDIARVDTQGYIYIVDRKKDIIKVSGFTVYPNELESIISCHEDILECAVVGLPDEVTGERIKLYVVPASSRLSIREIRDYCRERLTAYKVPRQVEFRQQLPYNSVGKVLRRQLRDEELACRNSKYTRPL